MADYHTPTIVEPEIPVLDVTSLERLLLGEIFECETNGDRLYLCHAEGANDYLDVRRADLANALAESTATESRMNAHAAAAPSSDEWVSLELDRAGASFDTILQDIVRRSPTLKYLLVVCSFTCSKMRPDGFGGAVTLITPDAILSKSTHDLVGELMAEAGVVDG